MGPPDDTDDIVVERRATVTGATSTVKLYVTGAVVMAAMTIGGVLGAVALAPNNPTIIPTIVGITSPIILALLGGGLHGMAVSIDGKMSQLLRATAEKEHAKGLIEGLKENPKTNI